MLIEMSLFLKTSSPSSKPWTVTSNLSKVWELNWYFTWAAPSTLGLFSWQAAFLLFPMIGCLLRTVSADTVLLDVVQMEWKWKLKCAHSWKLINSIDIGARCIPILMLLAFRLVYVLLPVNKLSSLKATLFRNYDPQTYGVIDSQGWSVDCRATTSVAKNSYARNGLDPARLDAAILDQY